MVPHSTFTGRRPVRLRLALIYSGLFLLAGAVLLTVTYGLVANSLPTTASASQSRKFLADPSLYPGAKLCKETAKNSGQAEGCKEAATKAAQQIANVTVQSERAQTLRHLLFYSLAGLAAMALASAIPDAEVPALFEPFRRRCTHDGPAGTGLGLSIVQSVVIAHHGNVVARPGPCGGLEITAMLPAV